MHQSLVEAQPRKMESSFHSGNISRVPINKTYSHFACKSATQNHSDSMKLRI